MDPQLQEFLTGLICGLVLGGAVALNRVLTSIVLTLLAGGVAYVFLVEGPEVLVDLFGALSNEMVGYGYLSAGFVIGVVVAYTSFRSHANK